MFANIARIIQRFMIAIFSTGIVVGLLTIDGSTEKTASTDYRVGAVVNSTP